VDHCHIIWKYLEEIKIQSNKPTELGSKIHLIFIENPNGAYWGPLAEQMKTSSLYNKTYNFLRI
jgi:hypothetical protein